MRVKYYTVCHNNVLNEDFVVMYHFIKLVFLTKNHFRSLAMYELKFEAIFVC